MLELLPLEVELLVAEAFFMLNFMAEEAAVVRNGLTLFCDE